MRTRITLTTALLVAGVALGMSSHQHAAHADPAITADVLEENLLLTPEEVAELGFSDERVQLQQDAYDALTPAQLAQQEALRVEQDVITAGVPEGEPIEVTTPPAAPPGTITPYVTEWPCWVNPSGYYRVTDHYGKQRCWASGGTLTWNSASIWYDVRHLRPGNYEGRILWDDNGASVLMWSVWRGPSSSTYTFASVYWPRMWGLQLR